MNVFDKINSYDLLTSLIPGAILLEAFAASGVPFARVEQIAAWLLLAYMLGMLCNRVGSLFVEPLIQRFVKRDHTYADYVNATKEDDRLESLVEKATFYRTMMTAGLIYLIGIGLFKYFQEHLSQAPITMTLGAILAIILFLMSYRKQEGYISKRVARAKK